MGTRELLLYIEKLEIGLSNFSYEELGTVEAGELKRSFDYFKSGLENKVFGLSEMEQLEVICQEVGIQGNSQPFNVKKEKNELSDINILLDLINTLQKTGLSKNQQEIAQMIKNVCLQLENSHKRHPIDSKNETNMPSNILSIEKDLQSVVFAQKVNLKPVLTECMGQMELLEELIRLYKQNIFEFIGSLKVNLDTEDFKEIEYACQKIQPCLRMMKTVSLLEITNQMVTVCKTDKDTKHLYFLYEQFLIEYPKVEEMVDFEIDVLRNM